jgi:hypothetical protein
MEVYNKTTPFFSPPRYTSFDDDTPLLRNCERMMNLPKKPFPYIGLAGLFPTASQQMLGRREEE